MRYDLLSILLVDDNQHMRSMLTEILRALGVQRVYDANDGAEALQVMRAHQVDIILTDLAMQPVDGIEFVRLLRNAMDSPNPMAPVIMITGHSTRQRITEARDVGVNEFLSKPVTVKGLIDRLTRVVENPRPFVRTGDYFGPERRRRQDPEHQGPWRRKTDIVPK